MFLGREPLTRTGLIDDARMNRDAVEWLRRLKLEVSPQTLVSGLRVGQQQVVEIAKALSMRARVIIMDEPTSAISEQEVAVLLVGGTLGWFNGWVITRFKLPPFVATLGMLSIAGLLLTARLDSATPNAGLGYELDSIAAVVIGGTSLSGGRGSVLGTVLGCLIIGVLNNGLVLMEVSPFWQQIIKGFVILAAVALDKMNAKE
jgi:ribose/xylose/arabinose/galactoside ABC-type transport system permease subunit